MSGLENLGVGLHITGNLVFIVQGYGTLEAASPLVIHFNSYIVGAFRCGVSRYLGENQDPFGGLR